MCRELLRTENGWFRWKGSQTVEVVSCGGRWVTEITESSVVMTEWELESKREDKRESTRFVDRDGVQITEPFRMAKIEVLYNV